MKIGGTPSAQQTLGMTGRYERDAPGRIKTMEQNLTLTDADHIEPTPLGDLLNEANNKTPEPDHMQWQQPVEVLLGRGTPNHGPTQDWEFDLINHQMAGNLDKPAYKNLTPEIIQLAAEKGAPAGSQTDAAPTDGQGPVSATPASPGPLVRAAQSHVQRRHAQREGMTGGKPSLGATPTPIDGDKRKQSRHGTRTPKTGQIQVPPRFQQLVRELEISPENNFRRAQEMGLTEFLDTVGSGGDWDYKKDKTLREKYGAKLMDDFGNWHFGVVANGWGFNLESSLYGAGAYQTLRQKGGSVPGFAGASLYMGATTGGYTMFDKVTEFLTRSGMNWGDNPGDSVNILEGWRDADTAF